MKPAPQDGIPVNPDIEFGAIECVRCDDWYSGDDYYAHHVRHDHIERIAQPAPRRTLAQAAVDGGNLTLARRLVADRYGAHR